MHNTTHPTEDIQASTNRSMPPKNSKGKSKPSGIPKSKADDSVEGRVPDNPRAAQRAELLQLSRAQKPPSRLGSATGTAGGNSIIAGVRTCSQSRAASTTSTTKVRNTLKSAAPSALPVPAAKKKALATVGNTSVGEEVWLSQLPIPGTFETTPVRVASRAGTADLFDEMDRNPEEPRPQDSALNVPDPEPTLGPRQRQGKGRAMIETIKEEDQGNMTSAPHQILQGVVNSVFATLRGQREEIEEMRVNRAREIDDLRETRRQELEELKASREAEIKEMKQKRRDEDERYHQLVCTLMMAQQQVITVASTQGLEVPDVQDFFMHTLPTGESPLLTTGLRTVSTPSGLRGCTASEELRSATLTGTSQSKARETERVTALREQRDAPRTEAMGERARRGPDTTTRLKSALLPERLDGETASKFMRNHMTQEYADLLSRPTPREARRRNR